MDRLGQPISSSDQDGGHYSSLENRHQLLAYNQIPSSGASRDPYNA
jgi:hypothetical protein